jgi:hypothetical protein
MLMTHPVSRRAAVVLVLSFSMGVAARAAPAVDPLLQKIIAGARAVPPSSIRFERTTRAGGRDQNGPVETEVRVDRWDGRQMTRISINGRPATADEVEKARKASTSVAGYHRIAEYLAGGARRTTDTAGQIVYHLDRLPKGLISLGGDRSDKFVGDLTIDTSGAQPFVSRLHFYTPKPFSVMFVAKVDRFDVVNDYRPGADGRPMLVRQVQTIAGAQFGKVGETRTESTYTPLR